MRFVKVIDGGAYVTGHEHECCDCGFRGATGLTREGALAAARELLELASLLMTDAHAELGDGLARGLRAASVQGRPLLISGLAPTDKVAGFTAEIRFEKGGEGQ